MSSSEFPLSRALLHPSAVFIARLSGPVLGEARWLSARRLCAYSAIMIAASVAMILFAMSGHGLEDPSGRPIGTDFVSFWTVSSALLEGRQALVYIPQALYALEKTLAGGKDIPFYAWQYPPIALLLVYPLALLPYLYALALWLGAGIAGYLSLLWRILPRRETLKAGLAFPAVLLTVLHGQNAFLTASLLGWGLLFLRRRPAFAGVLFGVLAFKPQLGVLLPVALLAGKHWRAFGAAAATVAGLAAASAILFGPAIWREFLAGAPFAGAILDDGLVPYYKMQSVFAAVRLEGGPLFLAYSVQALVALAVAAFLIRAWRLRADPDLQNAALLAAIPLATPFCLDYDLMVIAPAILWLAKKGLEGRALPFERTALAAAAMAPLFSPALGASTGVLLAPVVMAALFAVIMRRLFLEARA